MGKEYIFISMPGPLGDAGARRGVFESGIRCVFREREQVRAGYKNVFRLQETITRF